MMRFSDEQHLSIFHRTVTVLNSLSMHFCWTPVTAKGYRSMLTFDRKKFTTRAAERGQSLVEFTFGLMAMLMIVSGLLDIGRAYFTFVALEDAAGEAALFLAINPYCPYDGTNNGYPVAIDPENPGPGEGIGVPDNGDPGDSAPLTTVCDPPNNAAWRAHESGSGLIEWSNAVETVATPSGVNVGEPVVVTIRYDFQLLMPIIPDIAGANTLTLTAQASQIIVTE